MHTKYSFIYFLIENGQFDKITFDCYLYETNGNINFKIAGTPKVTNNIGILGNTEVINDVVKLFSDFSISLKYSNMKKDYTIANIDEQISRLMPSEWKNNKNGQRTEKTNMSIDAFELVNDVCVDILFNFVGFEDFANMENVENSDFYTAIFDNSTWITKFSNNKIVFRERSSKLDKDLTMNEILISCE
jgi:hypothetical protein